MKSIDSIKMNEAMKNEIKQTSRNNYKLWFWRYVFALGLLNGALCALGYVFSIVTYLRKYDEDFNIIQAFDSEFRIGLALAGLVVGVTWFVGVTCVNGGAAAQREWIEKERAIDNM